MKKTNKKKNKKMLFILITILCALIIWAIWANTALMTSRISLTFPDLPQGFENYRIAQISDLHNASFGNNNTKLLDLLRKEAPDIIVITGDIIDSRHTDMAVAADFVREAVQIAPIYYVTGNHEARLAEYPELEEELRNCGVIVLNDSVSTLEANGDTAYIYGLADPNFSVTDWLLDTTENITREKLNDFTFENDAFTVLLAHRPEVFPVYSAYDIDLVFTGHAHGGQIRLPFIGGIFSPGQGFFPSYDSGIYTENNTVMVLSRGLGNSAFPLRINNRPQVIVVTLKRS